MFNITIKEQELLIIIAEYQILLTEQISLITNLGRREVQRKINNLNKKDLINFVSRKPKGTKGRNENIISINEKGFEYLQNEKIIYTKISIEKFTLNRYSNIEHQLLLNWFRIHLNYMPKKNEDLYTDFIPSASPFLQLKSNGLTEISESFSFNKVDVNFIPDGVFYFQSKLQNKSLLFFLEVDMGTESLVSHSSKSNNIASKIQNYRAFFQTENYKKYQTKWNTLFNGFRVLFITNTSDRKIKISNLVNSEKSNDFIWIAHQYDLFDKGLGGKIWARGGNLNTSQESILGPTLNFEERLIH